MAICTRRFSSGTLTDGKHKGQTFEEVQASDPGYCKWVLGLQSPKATMKPFIEFLQNQKAGGGSEPAASGGASDTGSSSTGGGGTSFGSGSDVIAFGKHKGKTYDQMESQEADYCRWLVKNAKENPSKPPNDFVKYLMAKNGDPVPSGGGGGGGFAARPKLNADGVPLKNGDWICNFGKHSGLTFAQIYEKDRSYLQWFVKTTLDDTKTPRAESLALALYTMHRDGQQGGKRF